MKACKKLISTYSVTHTKAMMSENTKHTATIIQNNHLLNKIHLYKQNRIQWAERYRNPICCCELFQAYFHTTNNEITKNRVKNTETNMQLIGIWEATNLLNGEWLLLIMCWIQSRRSIIKINREKHLNMFSSANGFLSRISLVSHSKHHTGNQKNSRNGSCTQYSVYELCEWSHDQSE